LAGGAPEDVLRTPRDGSEAKCRAGREAASEVGRLKGANFERAEHVGRQAELCELARGLGAWAECCSTRCALEKSVPFRPTHSRPVAPNDRPACDRNQLAAFRASVVHSLKRLTIKGRWQWGCRSGSAEHRLPTPGVPAVAAGMKWTRRARKGHQFERCRCPKYAEASSVGGPRQVDPSAMPVRDSAPLR
jgi:hypothetical protein